MSKRVIDALKVIREEEPDYFTDSIMSDCPCNIGLPAKYRKWCGMEPSLDGTKDDYTPEYCERCWAFALGDEA